MAKICGLCYNIFMNKLDGFFKLNSINLPTVEWKAFQPGIKFSNDHLWTVRCAVMRGKDFELPRLIGAEAIAAQKFAENLYSKLGAGGLVIYYPFFVAELSGTLIVSQTAAEIECVRGDLWNLVDSGHTDGTLKYDFASDKLMELTNTNALTSERTAELVNCASVLRRSFRDELAEGSSIYTEWSYAFEVNEKKLPHGQAFLVFYELKTL